MPKKSLHISHPLLQGSVQVAIYSLGDTLFHMSNQKKKQEKSIPFIIKCCSVWGGSIPLANDIWKWATMHVVFSETWRVKNEGERLLCTLSFGCRRHLMGHSVTRSELSLSMVDEESAASLPTISVSVCSLFHPWKIKFTFPKHT